MTPSGGFSTIVRSVRRHGFFTAIKRFVLKPPYYYRTDIINRLIAKYGYTSYLEIGVHDRSLNTSKVNCDDITGVDPDPRAKADFVMSSDEFFAGNTRRFDIVFVDGLHHSEQVYRDIVNALRVLNDGGTIVCHDLNPADESEQLRTSVSDGPWTGDCWKAWVQLRTEREDLEMFVVDADFGCGIIRRGAQPRLRIEGELTWPNFKRHKRTWLNLISVDEFKSRFPV